MNPKLWRLSDGEWYPKEHILKEPCSHIRMEFYNWLDAVRDEFKSLETRLEDEYQNTRVLRQQVIDLRSQIEDYTTLKEALKILKKLLE